MNPITTRLHVKNCLVRSTLAKEKVFSAQDAAEAIDDRKVRLKVQNLLSRARADLEAVDRLLRPVAEGWNT